MYLRRRYYYYVYCATLMCGNVNHPKVIGVALSNRVEQLIGELSSSDRVEVSSSMFRDIRSMFRDIRSMFRDIRST